MLFLLFPSSSKTDWKVRREVQTLLNILNKLCSFRKPFAARECSTCKIRHPAREGDIWAETSCFGFRWKYLALMEGNVYDITQWALCQRGALSHLQANSCVVQYKIVLGGNGGNQQQNQAHDKEKFKKDASAG